MKPVGGYFELELNKGCYAYHQVPYTFKSGRAALHYILRLCQPTLVYVPFYTCNALLQSFEAAGIAYMQYAIDEKLDPVALPDLQPDEYFLYINYFGLKEATVQMLSARYGQQLIADCTQAFFTKGNGRSWFFNSCRKFFGVPDGAYLYPPDSIQVEPVESNNETYTLEHLIKRFNGHVQEGYAAFQEKKNHEFVMCFHETNTVDANNYVIRQVVVGRSNMVYEYDWRSVFHKQIATLSVVFSNCLSPGNKDFIHATYGDKFLFTVLSRYGKLAELSFNGGNYRKHIGGIYSGRTLADKYKGSIETRKFMKRSSLFNEEQKREIDKTMWREKKKFVKNLILHGEITNSLRILFA